MANLMILSKVKATAHYADCVAPANVTNGNFVALGAQNADKTYDCAAPAATTSNGVNIVCDIPISYEIEKLENDFTIATGAIIRTRTPEIGDVECYPVANFTATVAAAAGKFIIIDAGALKGEIVAAIAGTESLAYIIDEVFTKAGVSMLKMRCIIA